VGCRQVTGQIKWKSNNTIITMNTNFTLDLLLKYCKRFVLLINHAIKKHTKQITLPSMLLSVNCHDNTDKHCWASAVFTS